jgi:hypothetical protein
LAALFPLRARKCRSGLAKVTNCMMAKNKSRERITAAGFIPSTPDFTANHALAACTKSNPAAMVRVTIGHERRRNPRSPSTPISMMSTPTATKSDSDAPAKPGAIR